MAVYKAAGGADALGKFVYNEGEPGCVLALYEKGLISQTTSGVHVTKGKIFDKMATVIEGVTE